MPDQTTPIVDYLEAGSGPCVVLAHSSVAGARQWRRLMAELKDSFHLRAVNLFGYGGTPPWSGITAREALEVVITFMRRWLSRSCTAHSTRPFA
jgi:pimeloyl-ACP methyl ester carboxylesterase